MNSKDWYFKELIKGMLHWQSPPWIDDRSWFDAQKIIKFYSDAGIKTITPHTKHIDGYCFYPSKYRELKAERDFIGELVIEAKKAGIRTIPYYMVVVDKWAGSEHPEWVCKDSNGNTKEGYGSIFCCINNPGYSSYVLGQIKEIVDNYEVDGIWSDELNWGDEGCFCSYCRSLFGRRFGLDLSKAKGKQLARDFFNQCWEEFTHSMNEIICGGNSGRIFIYNGGGLHSYSASFGKYTASNSCEAHSALFASERGRYLRGLDKPYEICFATEKDWGGMLLNTGDEVRLITAEIAAHGGTAILGTNFTPQGMVIETGMKYIKDANCYIEAIKEFLVDTKPVYDVGIVWPGPEEPKVGLSLMQFDIPYCYVNMSQDWSGLKVVYSQTFSRTNAESIGVRDDVDDVFLDGSIPGDLHGNAADVVRKYVADGGVFIMELPNKSAHEVNYSDFIIKDVMGVSFAGKTNYDGHYVRILKEEVGLGLPDDLPTLVVGDASRIRADTAEVWAEIVYPLKPLDDLYKMQKYITNAPDGRIQSTPAITVNKYGKGYGVCVAVPLSKGTMPLKFGKGHPYHFWPRKLLANLLVQLTDNPLLKPHCPLGVEVVVNRQESRNRHVIHLFNHYGLRGVPYARESYYEPNPETVNLSDVQFTINRERLGNIGQIYAVIGKDALKVREEGKWIHITVPRLGQHELVIIEDI